MKSPMKKPMPATKKHEASKKAPPAKAPAPGAGHMPMVHEEMKYKAQDALHTLRRAHEIQQDPHLMKHVQEHAKEQRGHLNRIIRKKVK